MTFDEARKAAQNAGVPSVMAEVCGSEEYRVMPVVDFRAAWDQFFAGENDGFDLMEPEEIWSQSPFG